MIPYDTFFLALRIMYSTVVYLGVQGLARSIIRMILQVLVQEGKKMGV